MQPYSGTRVCVALSGGADSVCLLHYFHSHALEYSITLSAVTCEHGIRGENSLKDLAFVEKLCKDWKIPLHIFREDVPKMAKNTKIGLEEAGRYFRYACFDAMLQGADGADVIATAHHKDDLIETVLFRLIRGTSLGGLNVFPKRNKIIRPLSNVTRAQIMQYVQTNSLPYVTDESNSDETYTRNYLRHTALPALERAVNGAGEHLAEFALRASQDDAFLQDMAEKEVKRCATGESAISASLPLPLFTRACVMILKQFGVVKDYTEANLKEIVALKSLQSGKRISLPQGLCAVREYGDIVFYFPHSPTQTPFEGEIPFEKGAFSLNGNELIVAEEINGEMAANFPDSPVAQNAIRETLKVDLDAFPENCVIRTRREGDLFTPFGGKSKTLKKFLTDKKISARRGRLLPLIACGNEILAVCGVEIADRVKISPHTKRIGYLYMTLRVEF